MQGIPNNNPLGGRQNAVVDVPAGVDPSTLGSLLLVRERRADPTYIRDRRLFTTTCTLGLCSIFVQAYPLYFSGIYPLGNLVLLGTTAFVGVLGGIVGYGLFTFYTPRFLDTPEPRIETIGRRTTHR